MFPADPSSVLAAIARLVAESPGLSEAVSRAALVLRDVIPFESLYLLRLDRADSFAVYTSDPAGHVEVTTNRIAATGLPVSGADAEAPSRLVVTMRVGPRVFGAAWLTSRVPDAFTAEHQALMDTAADLLVLALQHTALRERESLRRERIDSLRRLLLTMAGALDIRQVFPEISSVARGVLPHDMMALTAWGETGASLRIYAIAGVEVDDPGFWEPMLLSDVDREALHREPYVVHDADDEVAPDTLRGRIFRRFGVRSALRVAMNLGNDVFGSLFFLSRDADRFSDDDIDFARRVADHLALALSHQRLAEAARRDEESREIAARLNPHQGARDAQRPAPGGRSVARVEGRAGPGHPRRPHGDDRAADGRIGNRQGGDRALHPPRVAPQPRAVHRHQLRRAARSAARVGAVRTRARRVHGRRGGQARPHRAGQRRGAVPRRGR
jgi:GAF domain-containing protein